MNTKQGMNTDQGRSSTVSSPQNDLSILLIAANPKGTASLRLQQEERDIKERLADSDTLHSIGATRPQDIQQAMLKFNPQIVHFTGHGAGESGLAFEDETGQPKLVDSDALASIFKLFSDDVKCVVLNACFSVVQAKAIEQHIDYVIGMCQAISDPAAIRFSVGFYTALRAGKSFEFAHKMGCNEIQSTQLAGMTEHLTPVLLGRLGRQTNPPSPPDSQSEKVEITIKVTGSFDECTKQMVEVMVAHFQKITGDASLTLLRTERGCIKLILEGSEEGFKRLEALAKTGELEQVLGIHVQKVEQCDPNNSIQVVQVSPIPEPYVFADQGAAFLDTGLKQQKQDGETPKQDFQDFQDPNQDRKRVN